ncbi:classical arabinogalactan protein 1-like [Pistacia vera]|uniref:classical arabinogalactan protein 1-like n=1 Tax=Pistacia vera TaxID=55513 RepID=UPI0012630DC6|nr:classical arabinogalactan protein 1-like [Pistacia vera]
MAQSPAPVLAPTSLPPSASKTRPVAAPSPSKITPAAAPSPVVVTSPLSPLPSISSTAPTTSPSSIAFPPSQAPAPAENAAIFNRFAGTGSLAVGLFAAVLIM